MKVIFGNSNKVKIIRHRYGYPKTYTTNSCTNQYFDKGNQYIEPNDSHHYVSHGSISHIVG
jgi:hypothetical protein